MCILLLFFFILGCCGTAVRSKVSLPYFLCPISKVRYDYRDDFVCSIPQAMIFFDFFRVVWVGFRLFFLHAPPSMCERSKKSRSVPKWPYFGPFPGAKECREKRKKSEQRTCFSSPRHHSGFLSDSPRS